MPDPGVWLENRLATAEKQAIHTDLIRAEPDLAGRRLGMHHCPSLRKIFSFSPLWGPGRGVGYRCRGGAAPATTGVD
jgi:hypothetical protein